MTVAPNQLQMGTDTTRGARAGHVSARTCRWQDRAHVLPGGQTAVDAFQVYPAFVLRLTFLLTSQLGRAFGLGHFSHSHRNTVPLPPRVVWAGRMRALHGAALRSRFNLQLRKHADRQIANAFEAHSFVAFRGGRSSMTNHQLKGSAACSQNRGIPLP